MRRIEPEDLVVHPFALLDQSWALLCTGKEKPNIMTVSWGGFGTIWNNPTVTIYVRPTRHSYSLLTAHPEFTLNFCPEARRAALELCGSCSGRDTDKWTAASLTPLASERIAVPRVGEAHLSLECRVKATFDITPDRFLDPHIDHLYPEKDYHRMFLGAVEAVWAVPSFVHRQ